MPGQGPFFPSENSNKLNAFCDVDWGRFCDTQRSVTGYCISLGKSLISWRTKKQMIVSWSSAEAKCRSTATTSCKFNWLGAIMRDLGIEPTRPANMYYDNQAALHITTKHIEMDCHMIQEKVQEWMIRLSHILHRTNR